MRPDTLFVAPKTAAASLFFFLLFSYALSAAEHPTITALPLQAGPGLRPAEADLGYAAQNVIENVLLVDGGLNYQPFLSFREELFPTARELTSWVHSAQAPPPPTLHTTELNLVLTGRLRRKGKSLHARLELTRLGSGERTAIDVAVDLPSLVRFRAGVVTLLTKAGLAPTPDQKQSMLWNENLPPAAFALLAEGVAGDVLAGYGDKPYPVTTFEQAPDETANSYLLANWLGWLYHRNGAYSQAEKAFARAVTLNPAAMDARDGLANVLIGAGNSAQAEVLVSREAALRGEAPAWLLGQMWTTAAGSTNDSAEVNRRMQKALAYFEQALATRRESQDRPGETEALHEIGSIYYNLKQYEKAVSYFEPQLAIVRASKDRRAEAKTLTEIGLAWRNLSQDAKAIGYFEQALAIRREMQDRAGEALLLYSLGTLSSGLHRFEQSIAYYQQAAALDRELGDHAAEGRTLAGLAEAWYNSGDKQKALEFYSQSLSARRAAGDRAGEVEALFKLATLYLRSGEKQKALEFASQALPVQRALGDHAGEAEALSIICTLSYSLGDKPKALDACSQALAIQHASGDHAGEAQTLTNIGRLYRDLGDKQKALDVHTQALAIERTFNDPASEAEILDNIGIDYHSLGNDGKALDFCKRALPIRHAAGDRAGEAEILNHIAIIYDDSGDKQKALEFYRQVLPIRHDIGDRAGEAQILFSIATVYADLHDRKNALEFYQQARTIRHDIGDRAGEAQALNKTAAVHLSVGENQEALDALSQALPLEQSVGDRPDAAQTLFNVGTVYGDQGQKQKALEFYTQALAILHDTGDRVSEARTLTNIGYVHENWGELQAALDAFQQALAIERSSGDRSGEARTLKSLCTEYHKLNQKQKALEVITQAASLYRALGDRAGEAGALTDMGNLYILHPDPGETQQGLELLNQALSIYRALGDRQGEGHSLHVLGTDYDVLGQKDKALEFLAQSIAIFRAIGSRASEASAMSSAGGTYSSLGQQQKALEFFNQALAIFREVHDRYGEAGNMLEIGVAYTRLGDIQKALEYFKQALSLSQSSGDRENETSALTDLGKAQSFLGDNRKALELLNQSLAIDRSVGNQIGEALALRHIAEIDSDLGETAKALDTFNQALPFFRTLGIRLYEGAILSDIGSVYAKLGEQQKALASYNQALPLQRSTGARENEAKTLGRLSDLFRKSQPDLAILFGKRAVNVLQSIRQDNRGLDDKLQSAYEKFVEPTYRSLADLLINRGRFGEAEEVLNLLKDKEASNFIQRDTVGDKVRSATLSPSEKSALERYDQNLDQLATLGQRRATLAAKPSLTPDELQESKTLDARIDDANEVLNLYLQQLQDEFSPKLKVAKNVVELKDAENLQQSLDALGPGVVAIYTLVMPDKYVAMLVTSWLRKAYSFPIPEADLNQKIENFRQLLQNPSSDPLPLAQDLYRIVFPEGLRKDLDAMHVKTIMWSVDSTLRYIPFAALHDGRQYLVQSFQQSLFTPDLLNDITVAPHRQWTGVGFGVSQGPNPLPSVRDELKGIFKETPDSRAPIPGVVRLDGAFTRDSFLDDLRHKRPVVHIATHFDSRPGSAENSKLLLGDGEMTLTDIWSKTRLFDGVDLLTLSACNTAFKNGYQDGEEVDSLGTILERKGAKAVVASLWSVNDPATARLMEMMYQLHQSTPGLAKGEALREAQVAMLTGKLNPNANPPEAARSLITAHSRDARKPDSGWSHPYYWAPFILMGNWK